MISPPTEPLGFLQYCSPNDATESWAGHAGIGRILGSKGTSCLKRPLLEAAEDSGTHTSEGERRVFGERPGFS